MTLTLERPVAEILTPLEMNIPASTRSVSQDIETACARVPPLWPLQNFVAVNPFVGLSDTPFVEACTLMRRTAHARLLMPAQHYRQPYQSGEIDDRDLVSALAQSGTQHFTVDALQAALRNGWDEDESGAIFTVADALDASLDTAWRAFMVDEISKWCSAYYDKGQASWRMPWRDQGLFAAWKNAALLDANPEMMGLKNFRQFVKTLPDSPQEVVEMALETLQIPQEGATDFLHREMLAMAGWSGYVQYLARENGLYGRDDDSLPQFLAILLAYEIALYQQHENPQFRTAWMHNLAQLNGEYSLAITPAYLWQLAAENAYQRRLLAKLAAHESETSAARPVVQSVFCIDVRSEVLRRALEKLSPNIETVGFAGFFGFPIEWVPFGQENGAVQCPVLLTPAFRIRQALAGATAEQTETALSKQLVEKRLGHSWNSFKTSAVSCFAFVETGGVLSGVKLVKDALGLKHHDDSHAHEMAPCLKDDGDSGMSLEAQIKVAAGALTNIGLTKNLARLVMICGHGSSTTNNPYGSGLDCGACGGHSGQANARVAAKVLNRAEVRAGIRELGIAIPDDTYFLAALHNTTTDDVSIFDTAHVPSTHRTELQQLQSWLKAASHQVRVERAPSLGLKDVPESEIDAQVRARSDDWAQTRPEWGLAGNAAYIAAPRERTRTLDLQGRSFLNNYDYQSDADGAKLELIMTAPMVVASWISWQYFASTVDNPHFGSGNKTIHNVVGTLGVWQGNCGDLQVGLPLQSVHDGHNWRHEPLRLSVLIEAPRDMMNAVIAKHEGVRDLLDNGWLHLIAIEDKGKSFARYCGNERWETMPPIS